MTTINAASEAEAGFVRQFDEPIERVLDLDTWSSGADLDRLYARLDQEVRAALAQDGDHREIIRRRVFPQLARRRMKAEGAGVYQATPDDIRRVHAGLLFSGAVEAADGTIALHDTLPLTVAQIGVGLVSYSGDQGTWVHRLFRRDVRAHVPGDPAAEVLELLEARDRRSAFERDGNDPLSRLARRGLMSYAERAVLVHKSTARWRMGHGHPTPVELLTGSESEVFLDASITILRGLINDIRRFVFIPSAPTERLWLTLGSALEPLEYAIVETQENRLISLVERGPRYGPITPKTLAFAREIGPSLVMGIYRASRWAPGQVFYAHADHAHEAALIAMADSLLHEHRGFPMLIDLADTVCSAHFSATSFAASIEASYAAAGAPYRYLHERDSRKG
ncbi:MAG: hypothetical protein AB7R89_15995 [Dehalococcoidia bacterium]